LHFVDDGGWKNSMDEGLIITSMEGPVGEQKGAQREVQQEEYCNPGVISLSPIRSQVDRPVLLP
jgi:hypothetical protein